MSCSCDDYHGPGRYGPLTGAPGPGSLHPRYLASLLDVTIGKQLENSRLARLLVTAGAFGEISGDMPDIRRYQVLGKVFTHKRQDHPVFVG